MDLGDSVLKACTLDVFGDFAIPECSFKGDELSLLERSGELREIAPGVDAMPFGTGLVVALVVLPALLSGEVEDGVLAVVLGCFCLCVLSEAARRVTMSEEDALDYTKRARKFRDERGRLPSLLSNDPWEKKLAEGVAAYTEYVRKVRAAKARDLA